jgi:hypothetical protein
VIYLVRGALRCAMSADVFSPIEPNSEEEYGRVER